MSNSNVASWLPALIGPVATEVDGVPVIPRSTLKFEGAEYEDDPDNDAAIITIPTPEEGIPTTRALTAGAGLSGGGDLTADRTFDVVANADASIVVNANDIQVGVLATDAQHGVRGGGTQHADATTSVAGFMSAADKTKIDSFSVGALDIVRPSQIGEVIAGTWGAGNFTGSTRFKTHRALTITGIRAWVKFPATKNIKASIYTSASGTPLATVTVSSVNGSPGSIQTFTFASPLALPACPAADTYYAAVYETSGVYYPVTSAASALTYLGAVPFFMNPFVLYRGSSYVAGDAKPTTDYAPGTTEFYPVEPIISP